MTASSGGVVLKNYIPESSAKTKTSIRIFTVMMNMEAGEVGGKSLQTNFDVISSD